MTTFRTVVTALALMASIAWIPPAEAQTIAVKLQAASTLIIEDNGPLDSNLDVGILVYAGPFEAFSVTVVVISKPLVGNPSLAKVDMNVVSSTTSGGTLVVSVTDTDFPGPLFGDTTVISSIGGTTDLRTSFQTFVDTDNAAFGTGATSCTAGLRGPFSGVVTDTTQVPCTLSGAFSVTAVSIHDHPARGIQSYGASIELDVPETQVPAGCRFTGGGVDTDGNWNHVLEDGEMIRNGAGHLPAGVDRYQFGGQVGARTAMQPQPSGEWQHHQQRGPSGRFAFHGGTNSAAPGTRIVDVRCSDGPNCSPARPAPAKQLDFDAIGTFSNTGNGNNAPVFQVPNPNVIPEPNGNSGAAFTFHWFEVNIDDLGEPGGSNSGAPDPVACPGRGFGEKSAGPFPDPGGLALPYAPLANCDCPDFYRITIYRGVLSTEVAYLPGGGVDPTSVNRTDVIYESFGYIDGGNLQIHPPTGFDQ